MALFEALSSNATLMADFNELGRQIYIESLAEASRSGFHPGLIGKPLVYVSTRVHKDSNRTIENNHNDIFNENIVVKPFEVGNYYEAAYGYGSNYIPNHLINYRQAVRDQLSQTQIDSDLNQDDLIEIIKPSTIFSVYMACDHNNNVNKYVNYRDYKTSKRSIVSAINLSQEAVNYIETIGVNKPISYGHVALFNVYFDLEMTDNLPLNGHEPFHFLQAYYKKMAYLANKTDEKIRRLRTFKGPRGAIEQNKELKDKYLLAARRAFKILTEE